MIELASFVVILIVTAALSVFSYSQGGRAEAEALQRRQDVESAEFGERMRQMLTWKSEAAGPWYSVQEDGPPRGPGWYLVSYEVAYEASLETVPKCMVSEFYYDREGAGDRDFRAPGMRWRGLCPILGEVTHWANLHPPAAAPAERREVG